MTGAREGRLPDWRRRLDDYLDSVDGRLFEWGSLDCALFAADCVLAQTGVDFAADFRGQYTTGKGAALAVRGAGYSRLDDLAASRLTEIPMSEAAHGDIAAVLADGRPALVMVNRGSLICMAANGKASLHSDRGYRAFRVG